jgi:hypothetical protein
MDFSTVDLALSSLTRRHPPLSNEVIDLSSRLKSLHLRSSSSSSSSIDDDGEYVRGALRLIELGSTSSRSGGVAAGEGATSTSTTIATVTTDGVGGVVRWESLAVGLRLVVDYLDRRTGELRPHEVGVYADGPRIPEISTDHHHHRNHPLPPGKGGQHTTDGTTVAIDATSAVFDLMSSLPAIVDANVEHPEPRVRSLVARTVGAHALYATSLLDVVAVDDGPGGSASSSSLASAIRNVQVGRRRVHSAILRSLRHHMRMKSPMCDGNASRATDGALDDTTGWRALETNLNALASYVDGCVGSHAGGGGSYVIEERSLLLLVDYTASSSSFAPHGAVDDGDDDRSWFLPGLRDCCVSHVNRHVRAAGAALIGAIVESCVRSSDVGMRDVLLLGVGGGGEDGNADITFRDVIGEALRANLADNWSQVRMAGSVLCRGYALALMAMARKDDGGGGDEGGEGGGDITAFEEALGDLVPMLLPRMCLNRFYLAQGVKLYSQETWRLVFGSPPSSSSPSSSSQPEHDLHSSGGTRGGGGLGAVSRNAAPICRYYSKMCDADNHAVREAACQGVAELAQKVGTHPIYAECLSPYVTMLLQVSTIPPPPVPLFLFFADHPR